VIPTQVERELPRRPGLASIGRAGRRLDAATILALCGLAAIARRPGYLLSHSLWLDEGWVADSVRAPLSQIRMLTSSTPIGWTLLLRLVPHLGPPERLRLLPLAFGVAAVVAAWCLGRMLGRVQAVAAAAGAALAPSSLANHNLKQYSADVLVTLALLALGARLEARWSRGRLLALCLLCPPALLVSHVTVFVSAALLGALALLALLERDRARLAATLALGAATALVEGVLYATLASPGNNAGMQSFWAATFVPLHEGPWRAAAFVGGRLSLALGQVGLGPPLLAAALVACGVAVLWRAGLRATALAVPLLAALLVLAAAARRYPLLDERTSLFFTTLLTVLGCLAIGQVAAWALRVRPRLPASGRRARLAVATAAIAGAALLLVPAAARAAAKPSPGSSIGQQVSYVLDHRQPGDTVVVGWAASFPFAYYWPGRLRFSPETNGSAVLFQVDPPATGEVVITPRWKDQRVADLALRSGVARSFSGRVWLVLAESGDAGPVWPAAIRGVTRDGGMVFRAGPKAPRLLVIGRPGEAAGGRRQPPGSGK
jgi:hypothetical protein